VILKLTSEINREIGSTVQSWKFVRIYMCDIGIVEQKVEKENLQKQLNISKAWENRNLGGNIFE